MSPPLAANRPVVMIHGYSAQASNFTEWAKILGQSAPVRTLHIGNYASLTNEVTLKDIAEGFDRALQQEAGISQGEEFDAIVHSTGMLVVRSWLTTYAERRTRLKHLIGLAPASYGSPLAHKGRSWLGAIFKGNRHLGPDFLEAGDKILDGLELGSRFTWELAHRDLFGDRPFYGPDADTPYVFIFCGNQVYGGLRGLANEPGTDGTVRWAGCSLNSRKIILNLSVPPGHSDRAAISPWLNVSHIPLIFVDGVNHATIMTEPPPLLQTLLLDALKVDSRESLQTWCENAEQRSRPARGTVQSWQQFVVRLTDERGDPIPDFNVELRAGAERGPLSVLQEFDLDVHAYSQDKSLRCFHVNLDQLEIQQPARLQLCLTASSGSDLVGFYGFADSAAPPAEPQTTKEVVIDLSPTLRQGEQSMNFFHPFTTTLVDLRMNREPEPLPRTGGNRIYRFVEHLV